MAGSRILSRRWGTAGTFRQPCLPENGIGGMTARDADRDWKIALRDRAIPDFVAAFVGARKNNQPLATNPAERGRIEAPSDRRGLCFTQRSDLKE
jgi:hypothetical protein